MRALVDDVHRRFEGDVDVDVFGFDPEWQDVADAVVRQVIRVNVSGSEYLPTEGPALLVANRRLGVFEPIAVGRAVRQSVGRRMRFVGLPDLAPLSTPLRRLGAVVDRPAEVASLLRGGHIVGLPLAMQLRSRMRAGRLSPADVAPALQLGIPVIPVAVVGGELSGRWRVYVGEPIDPPRSQGPLALADLADGAQEAVQFRLDEAFPPRWPWG